jgi:hypothetical protein
MIEKRSPTSTIDNHIILENIDEYSILFFCPLLEISFARVFAISNA